MAKATKASALTDVSSQSGSRYFHRLVSDAAEAAFACRCSWSTAF